MPTALSNAFFHNLILVTTSALSN